MALSATSDMQSSDVASMAAEPYSRFSHKRTHNHLHLAANGRPESMDIPYNGIWPNATTSLTLRVTEIAHPWIIRSIEQSTDRM